SLEGRDATAFAQAQFMSDVRLLQPGQWQWSGWLTPKGRVIALFALLLRDPETVWLVLQDAEPDAFASALRRFVFRSKVTVSATDLHLSWACRSRHGGELLPTGGPANDLPGKKEVAAMAAPIW